MTRKGPRPIEDKAAAAALLAQGIARQEVADAIGIARETLWRWETDDPEFQSLRQRLTDATVAASVQEIRSLVPDMISAIRRGLHATHRQTIVKLGEDYAIVDLRDDSLAVQTADKAMRRVAELADKHDVELDASAQLTDLIRRLDARRDADQGRPAPAPVERAGLRGGQSVDQDEAPAG